MTYELPWPPSLNNAYPTVVRGNRAMRVPSARLVAFKAEVAAIVLPMRRAPATGYVGVQIALYPPTRRKFDIDNFVKPILDALTSAGVWMDDSQVTWLQVLKMDVTPDGMTLVEVTETKGT